MNQQVISEDDIARRAYEIWQSRGCPPGDGSHDWEAAKSQLVAERIHRNGSTQQRLQLWWRQLRDKFASPNWQ
jgi:hypothetical protein